MVNCRRSTSGLRTAPTSKYASTALSSAASFAPCCPIRRQIFAFFPKPELVITCGHENSWYKNAFLVDVFSFFASSPGTPLTLNLRGDKGHRKPQRSKIWATMASNSLFSSVTPCQQNFFWGKCPRFSLCFWPCGRAYNKDLRFERQQSCVDVYKHSARPAVRKPDSMQEPM